jgi:hypothetical protein
MSESWPFHPCQSDRHTPVAFTSMSTPPGGASGFGNSWTWLGLGLYRLRLRGLGFRGVGGEFCVCVRGRIKSTPNTHTKSQLLPTARARNSFAFSVNARFTCVREN